MPSIESLIRGVRDEATRAGDEFRIRCPTKEHEDKNPSCHINALSGAWDCKSCQANGSFADFIHLTYGVEKKEAFRLSEEAKGAVPPPTKGKRKPKHETKVVESKFLPQHYVAKYEYKDSRGHCYAIVYRTKTVKAFTYSYVNDGQWKNEAPSKRYPYRTEHLSGKQLLIVEGEKCADDAAKLLSHHFDVLTWMGGTNGAPFTDWTALQGLTVYLWPDHDKAGMVPMRYIRGQLAAQGCKVFQLTIPEALPPKWDISDAIAEWGDQAWDKIGQFIIANREEYEPNPFQALSKGPSQEEDDYDPDLEAEFASEENTTQLNKTSAGLRQALTLMGFQYRYNIRSQQHEVRRVTVDGKIYKAWYKRINYRPGWITVDDFIRATLVDLIERRFKLPNGKPLELHNKFDSLMLAATVDKQIDDFEEWLNELPPWDGVARIGMVAFDILGAYAASFADEAIPLISHMSSSLFIAPIQRTMEPGCTIDEIPVLLGPGEIGKTKFYSYVFPDDRQHWYAGPIDFGKDSRKELLEMTNGPVVVEVGEMRLSVLTEAQIARMKDFITRGHDRIRMAYGKRAVTIQRRFSMIATANKKATGTFYYDVDGHRRFVVIDVAGCTGGPQEAIAYLKENRLQLWAEGLHMYREGHRANVPKNLRYWQKEMAEQHVDVDEAYDALIHTLEIDIRVGEKLYDHDMGYSLFDIGDLLGIGVGDPSKFDRSAQHRLSSALARRDWQRRQRRVQGKRPWRWYVPPDMQIIQREDEG